MSDSLLYQILQVKVIDYATNWKASCSRMCTSPSLCVFMWVCVRDRDGVKVSAQSHSPNLIAVEFTLVPQEYKLGFIFFFLGKIDKNEFLPFITGCDELFMCVVCFWRMRSTPEGWGGGVTHLDGVLVFHCFCLKNEWVHSFSKVSESVYLYSPQSLSFSTVFPLNSWLIVLHWHTVDGNVSGTNGGCQAGVHGQLGYKLDSQWGLL